MKFRKNRRDAVSLRGNWSPPQGEFLMSPSFCSPCAPRLCEHFFLSPDLCLRLHASAQSIDRGTKQLSQFQKCFGYNVSGLLVS